MRREEQGRLSNSGARFFPFPLAIPSVFPAPGVTSADRGPVCVCAPRSGRMAVLKLTGPGRGRRRRRAGRAGAGRRGAPAGGWGAARSAPASCLLSRRRGGVRAAAGCPESRRLQPSSPARSPPWAARTARSAGGWGAPGAGEGAAGALAGVRGALSTGPAGQGGGGSRCSSGAAQLGSSPGGRERLVRAAGKRKVDGEGEGSQPGTLFQPSWRPAQTVALVWSGCLYPFDVTP